MTFDPDSFEGQVIAKLSKIETHIEVLPDHEKRLRWLERRANWVIGVIAFLAALFGIHVGVGK